MILNSRNNNFIVRFQKNFFYPEIVKKYETYIKRLPIPYENLHDYMTAGIQSITFPSLNAETVEQILYEDPVSAKGGLRPIYWLDRSFNISFKSYEGYINYWIMFDMFFEYYDMNQKNKYLGDVYISFLDQSGFEFIAVELSQITYVSLSELELDYSSNSADFKNFSAEFKYNNIQIKKRMD